MAKIKYQRCPIEGLLVIEPPVFGDNRGYFTETYNKKELSSIGINVDFVQDNQSKSSKGVLRGLHFQIANPQAKLVRVLSGTVFDVAVDLRRDSSTYGKWYGVILSEENMRQFYIPEGFAHGFYVMSESAVFCYKCNRYYDPTSEGGLSWDDPTLGIQWPLDQEPIVSEKDKHYTSFDEFSSPF